MAPAAEAEELEEELLAAWATATTAVAATILENCIANMCLSGDGKKKSKSRGGKVSNLYSPPVAPCTVVGPCQRNAPNALPQGSPAVCRRKVFRCCLRDGQRTCGPPQRGRVGGTPRPLLGGEWVRHCPLGARVGELGDGCSRCSAGGAAAALLAGKGPKRE